MRLQAEGVKQRVDRQAMKCADIIKSNSKFCKVICASYGKRWGENVCNRMITGGQDAICTMWPEIERIKKYGGKKK